MASLLAGIGSGLTSGIATSGGLANIMGSLVGSSLQSDIKNSGLGGVGQTGVSDIWDSLMGGDKSMPAGTQTGQTGAAASAQDAQAPNSLSPTNTNQYTAPTYNGISGNQSPFSSLMSRLIGGS